jgi:hypothetical protein
MGQTIEGTDISFLPGRSGDCESGIQPETIIRM